MLMCFSMNKYVFPGADASLPLGWVISRVSYLFHLFTLSLHKIVHRTPRSKRSMSELTHPFPLLIARIGQLRNQVGRRPRRSLRSYHSQVVPQLDLKQGQGRRKVRYQVVPYLDLFPCLLRHVSVGARRRAASKGAKAPFKVNGICTR